MVGLGLEEDLVGYCRHCRRFRGCLLSLDLVVEVGVGSCLVGRDRLSLLREVKHDGKIDSSSVVVSVRGFRSGVLRMFPLRGSRD